MNTEAHRFPARLRNLAICWLIPAAVAGTAGCGGSDDPPGDPDSGPGADITYYEDVAPILMQNCATCHRPEGIAPFSLLTLDDALEAAPALAPAVESRYMPPWTADNSGDCHTWEGARWLTDEEIQTIAAWARGDRAPGDPANAPSEPVQPPGLDRVDATLDMGVEYTPNEALSDDYRCFVVDYAPATEKFLTAFEVKPGEPEVVHHIVVFGLQNADAVAQAQNLDDAEAGPGYTCFGGAMVPASVILGVWAPGVRVNEYPAGTGLAVPATGKAVIQIHYNLRAGALPDRTSVDLKLEDDVNKRAFLALVANPGLSLPPGQDLVATSGTLNVPLGTYQAWAVYPHMHTLGRTLRVELERPGQPSSCMLDIPRWDFEWQQFFNYADGPVTAVGGDTIRITCGYDTSQRNETVTWGEGTLDEMCLSFLYTTLGL